MQIALRDHSKAEATVNVTVEETHFHQHEEIRVVSAKDTHEEM
jgi:hypothetical protein